VLALSRSSKVISKQRISVGAIDQTCVDIRLIMRVLIETGAVQFVAVHNHPSGNICPSMEDKKITERMNNAAALFNIRILDHVIITNDGYYSFNDEGLI
ncbi:JAB domain-containing protein, partial [Phocaeicola sartorii]